MANRESVNRRSVVSSVERILGRLSPRLLQANPYLPDLLNQPDYLIVPELGRLVALFVITPKKALTWQDALAAVEDLFEIKQSCGENTVAIAVVVHSIPPGEKDSVLLALLNGLFDGFASLDLPNRNQSEQMAELIASTQPRHELFELWRLERRRIALNLSTFTEQRYASFVDLKASRGADKVNLVRQATKRLQDGKDFQVHDKYIVRSPKETLAGLPERNRFIFDLGVERLSSGQTVPVDFALLGRYGSRAKLRYLMTKARLTTYDTRLGQLALREDIQRPVLMISGNAAGPSHDPYRYVRALVSVGWKLANGEASLREELHANF